MPQVLLLGGPNAFLRGMREAWQHNIPLLWKERGVELPSGQAAEDLIQTPPDALLFCRNRSSRVPEWAKRRRTAATWAVPRWSASSMRDGRSGRSPPGSLGSAPPQKNCRHSKDHYQPAQFIPATFQRGEQVEAFIGLDGGSTSTKAVLLSPGGEVLAKSYRLSEGNPIADAVEVPWAICGAK